MSTSADMDTRLRKLERDSLLFRVLLSLLALVLLSTCAPWSSKATLELEELRVKDEQGRVRLLLRGTGDEPGIGIFGEHGELMGLLGLVEQKGLHHRSRDPAGGSHG